MKGTILKVAMMEFERADVKMLELNIQISQQSKSFAATN